MRNIYILYCLILFIGMPLGNQKIYILKPKSLTDKIDHDDLTAIHLLFKDSFRQYSNWYVLDNTNDNICDNTDCAKLISLNAGSNKIVFGNIYIGLWENVRKYRK